MKGSSSVTCLDELITKMDQNSMRPICSLQLLLHSVWRMAAILWERCLLCQKITKEKLKCPTQGIGFSKERSLATYEEFLDNYRKLKTAG